ncbi:uncharacterized protein LOC105193608 [Solenopsis invicta]|uniref:uncharacterized protein LOC105193608 n=1 Tax=Solenopsis invicta TaxID=13686 RepID=UPI0005958F06|nr:uncharacterized protein LOC105193608 [Solenopsis invicta]
MHIVCALFNPGSELTLISESLSRELKLQRFRLPVSISGVGCVDAGSYTYPAQIELSSVHSPESAFLVIATIMRSLTPYSPSRAASQDPTSANPIEIIIGADLYSEILLDSRRKGEFGQPYAQNTIFGWVLSGPTSSSPFLLSASVYCCSHVTCSSGDSPTLDQALRRFWEVEESPRKIVFTPDKLQCEEHFLTTHSRCSDGRYIVRLPFKNGPPIKIGSSRGAATRCLSSSLRRFRKSPDLQKEYSEFLREYEEMDHMRESPPLSKSSQCVFIPRHSVIRDGSSTTRLRVVFNASSVTSNATSLNDHMLAGPKLQTELTAVILRWRQFRYVYSADIAKMYRQILVDPRDVDYQRILWCKSKSSCPREY